jgi:hypothetical protein
VAQRVAVHVSEYRTDRMRSRTYVRTIESSDSSPEDPLAYRRLGNIQTKTVFEPHYLPDRYVITALIDGYQRLSHQHNQVVARLGGRLAEINPKS